MSCSVATNDERTGEGCCANCGAVPSAMVRLKNCNACLLVKYCGVDCQKVHRKQHKMACKLRAAELKYEQLYSQGHERSEDDFCPICSLPIPLPMARYSQYNACCMKRICRGCVMAAHRRGMLDCPFCRTSHAVKQKSGADMLAMVQARAGKKDPVAIFALGNSHQFGQFGLQKDARKAVELWTEAAELGSIAALFELGYSYCHGRGVEVDMEKGIHFYEEAATQGQVESRYNLGCYEGKKGRHDRAVKHFLISAKLGDINSVDTIKKMFMDGLATKAQYAQALREYQDAAEEMKSPQRDEENAFMEAFMKNGHAMDGWFC